MLRRSLVLAFCCAVSSSVSAQKSFVGLPGWENTDDRVLEACDGQRVATVGLRYHVTYHGESGLSPQSAAAIDAFMQASWTDLMRKQTVELSPAENDLGYDGPEILQRMDEIYLSTLAHKLKEAVQTVFRKAVESLHWTGNNPTVSGSVSNLKRGCSLE